MADRVNHPPVVYGLVWVTKVRSNGGLPFDPMPRAVLAMVPLGNEFFASPT